MRQGYPLDQDGGGWSRASSGEAVRGIEGHPWGASGWSRGVTWGCVDGSVGVLEWIGGRLQAMVHSVGMWCCLKPFGGAAGRFGGSSAEVLGSGCCWHSDSEGHSGHQAGSRLFGLSGASCLGAGVSWPRRRRRFLQRPLLLASRVQVHALVPDWRDCGGSRQQVRSVAPRGGELTRMRTGQLAR